MRRMIAMRNDKFKHYSTDYISGVMSLREPQKRSLEILDDIMENLHIRKGMNLKLALASIREMYPTCTDFERDFISMTFALATGVGKTRLMGAFVAYLYTNHNVKNFFVVAPNTTIYDKLRRDFSDFASEKYVFKGLGCFANPPQIVTDDDYKSRQLSLFESDVRIFIYNIDKFNKDKSKMKKLNEFIGDSFYDYLSNLDDLVVLMDESHHYRAERGMPAINELNPMLGLELTATPLAKKGSKQVPFKNVVFEYPLSKSIEDGYTRTPYASTRTDVDFYNFGDEELDKVMILDGLTLHEDIKERLKQYAFINSTAQHPVRIVKPFMMVVCKDITHATWVENFIKSDECYDGAYRNKTIMVHSKQTGSESEANTQLLLSVERSDNPVEIVIHVDKLKEGWDVNNLYTIVPLRTASSKILREQMVGRGLRLPFGKRTGDSRIDGVYLTAHDKFQDLIEEAQKGNSIFKAGNIIKIEDVAKEKNNITQLSLDLSGYDKEQTLEDYGIPQTETNRQFLTKTKELLKHEVNKTIQQNKSVFSVEKEKVSIFQNVIDKIKEDKELGEIYKENEFPIAAMLEKEIEKTQYEAKEKFIPVPQLKINDTGVSEQTFIDFDMDLSQFNETPIVNELVLRNLQDPRDEERLNAGLLNFQAINPKKLILERLREKPEIDYEKFSELIRKLITQVCNYYEGKFGYDGLRNIVMMHKLTITDRIYKQMLSEEHFYFEEGLFQESVLGTREYNLQTMYNFEVEQSLYDSLDGKDIKSILFNGINKGVFDTAKFDSKPELIFARILERDKDVLNWLRPNINEFNITYNRDKRYVPDFVVETEKMNYIVEIKGEDKINSADVIAKAKRAIKYCEVASNWAQANGYKPWQYVFIPSKEVLENSSVMGLVHRFLKQ